VVLLVMMIITIVGMVMLERQSAQSLTIGRQVSGYDEHHASRGMKEAIDAWIRSSPRRSLRDRLDTSGRAFEIDLPTGLDGKGLQTLAISLADAQGTVLNEFTGFTGQPLEDAKAILLALRNAALPAESLYMRGQGPISISAASATPEVLRAVVEAGTGGEGVDAFVDAILKARDEGTLTNASIAEAGNAAQVSPEARAKLQRFVTADPTLWKVTVEVRRGGSTGPLFARYQGLAALAISSSYSRSSSQSTTRSSVFLTWEKQDAQQIMMEAAGL
jgi:hypothetical protein